MMRVLQDPAPRLRGVPDDLADLVVRTLAKDPADRFKSAEALGGALQAVQAAAGQPITCLRLAPSASAVPPTAGSASAADTAPLAPIQRGEAGPTIRHAVTRPQQPRGAGPAPAGSPVAERVAPVAAPPRSRLRREVVAAGGVVHVALIGLFGSEGGLIAG